MGSVYKNLKKFLFLLFLCYSMETGYYKETWNIIKYHWNQYRIMKYGILAKPAVIIGTIVIISGGTVLVKYEISKRGPSVELAQNESAENERIAELESKIKELEQKQSSSDSVVSPNKDNSLIKEIEALKKQSTELKKEAEKKVTTLSVNPVPTPATSEFSTSQIIEKVKPKVVAISTRNGKGSGFLVSKTAIATNEHVAEGMFRAEIRFSNGKTVIGYVAGTDVDEDLAIFSIPETQIDPLEFGDSGESSLKQGDSLFSFGFPFGLDGDVSFKEGTLSRRLEYEKKSYLEISNALLPGNSGGPLVNKSGQVVGINTAVYGAQTQDGTTLGETIKLAIPAERAGKILSSLLSKMTVLSEQKKTNIDAYENFMGTFSKWETKLFGQIGQYKKAFQDVDPDTVEKIVGVVDEMFSDILTLIQSIPSSPYKSKMTDTANALQNARSNTEDLLRFSVTYLRQYGTKPTIPLTVANQYDQYTDNFSLGFKNLREQKQLLLVDIKNDLKK